MTGKALRRARLRAGLSQAQLAALAGLTVGTVIRCERPDWPASALTKARLRRALEDVEAQRAGGPDVASVGTGQES